MRLWFRWAGEKEFEVAAGKRQFFQVPLGEFKGVREVRVSLNGEERAGPAITEGCPESEVLNFNVVAVDAVAPATGRGNGNGSGDSVEDSEHGPRNNSGGESGDKNFSSSLTSRGRPWTAVILAASIVLVAMSLRLGFGASITSVRELGN